jgi:hypothetical protein
MIQKMMLKAIGGLAVAGLALCLAPGSSAQDSHWNGTPGNTLWNVATNWTPVGVPPGTVDANVWLDAANGDSVITIPAGAVESPGSGTYDTIFGPEWGVTLNVYGTLNFKWLLFPVQNNPAPGLRSYVNLRDNAVVSTSGAAMGIGDSWFYTGAPYVTMNLYSNAQYNSFLGAGLWLGGHLNIYDNAAFLVNGYVNMDTAFAQSDGTRSINVGGGTFLAPENFSGAVVNWISRGILRAYGKGEDTTDVVITDNGANTLVNTVPLGGVLQQIYFQPLLLTNVPPGTFQQLELVGDYPAVTGVLLSSSEPGLDPVAIGHPVYTSSNPNVATVDTNGVVTAVGAGSATLTAKLGAFTSTNSLVLTVAAATTLIHEYKFSETSGTDLADSVPGNSPTWDGTLMGGATLTGSQVVLDGSTGYIQLPSGILSGLNQVTIEVWASFGSPIHTWANLFAFGGVDDTGTNGENYISLQPHTGSTNCSANFGQGDPGNNGEWDAGAGSALDGLTNLHLVVVYDPQAGGEYLYTNGVLAAQNSMFNNLMDPVAYAGPTYNSGSILNYTLGYDLYNYIGHSLYTADPTLNASLDEFRIYNGPLTAAQVAADHALGPNQFIGTSTNVSLTAKSSGGNLVITWPTASALVNLVSSPALGAGAVWSAAGTLPTTVGGNYQVTMPATGTARFYRLQ